jgi:P pilus assembly chaperone PapD
MSSIESVVGGKRTSIGNGMVEPYGVQRFKLPQGIGAGKIRVDYEAINDFGGRHTLTRELSR